LNVRIFTKMTSSIGYFLFSKSTFGINNIMDAFPLEFFNFITDVQPFKINQNFWPVKCFIINIILIYFDILVMVFIQ
jgi:hypothetical protein